MKINELTTEVGHGLATAADDVAHGARSLWLAGLGLAGTTAEETAEIFDRLVEKGRKRDLGIKPFAVMGEATEKVQVLVKDVGARTETVVEGATARVLETLGVPTRSEVQGLIDRVERLNARLASVRPRA